MTCKHLTQMPNAVNIHLAHSDQIMHQLLAITNFLEEKDSPMDQLGLAEVVKPNFYITLIYHCIINFKYILHKKTMNIIYFFL